MRPTWRVVTHDKLIVQAPERGWLCIVKVSEEFRVSIALQKRSEKTHSSKSWISSGATLNSSARTWIKAGWCFGCPAGVSSSLSSDFLAPDPVLAAFSWDDSNPTIGMNSVSLLNSNFWFTFRSK